MKKNKFMKKLSAAILTAALAAGLMATSVSAAPDPDIEGSITVHKLATMGESSTYHDGSKIEDTTMYGSPLADAGFTLYKVNSSADLDDVIAAAADPTSQAYSNAIAALKASATVVGVEQFTDAAGETVFDELTAGYYILEETTTPDGYATAKLSIITFPYGYNPDENNNNATTDYNYNIHVYPKNVNSSEVTKVVKNEQSAYVVGDTVTWEIGAKIDSSKELDTLKVTDVLDARLTYTSGATLTLTGGSDSVVLGSGDYSQSITTDSTTGAQTIVWELTSSGVAKAIEQGSTGIIVNIPTTVNEKAQGGATASIKNSADVYIKYGDGTEGGGEPDVDPEIKLGGIIIDKTQRDGTTKLANAKFVIALSKTDLDAKNYLKDADGNVIEVTTDTNGYAQFVDFTQANPEIDWDIVNTFYLVETQAPEGFILKSSAVEVKTSDDSDNAVKLKSVTILNQKPEDPPIEEEDPIFQLPLTGGMGTVLFTVIGAILMLGAAVILIKSRKKNA